MLFFLTILISGCAINQSSNLPSELVYPETELPLEIENCEDVLHDPEAFPFSDRDLCYYELAQEHKNPNVCSLIESETFDQNCYGNLANKMKDYRICGLLDGSGDFGLCYLEYLKEMPVGIEFCEYLTYGDHRAACIIEFTIINPNLDYEICDDISTFLGQQASCYRNIALNKKDPEGCTKINNRHQVDSCYEEVCELFEIKNERINCFEKYINER